VLELVHTDIYDPITPNSFGEHHYFITFINDFFVRTWVKGEIRNIFIFKKFKLLVENLSDKHIKALRSDRDGEYTSKEFVNFYEKKCIRRFLTTPYSPQQNKITERKNHIILNIVRSMLKSKNMSKKFWTKLVRCVVYLQN
jgi:hypothetical protein